MTADLNSHKELMDNVSNIASKVVYPRDPWGITSDLKAAVTKLAGRLGDNEQKMDIAIGTLLVALAHLQKRRDKDKMLAEKRRNEIKASAEDRKPRERF